MPDNVRDVWSDDELDAALAALGSDVDTDQRALDHARAELLAAARDDVHVADAPPQQPPQEQQPARRARRGWVAAVAAAAAAVVVSVPVLQFGEEPPVDNPAVQQLNSAADEIATHDEPVGPGQYRYVAIRAWYFQTSQDDNPGHDENPYSYLIELLDEIWMPANPRQEWLLRTGETGSYKWVRGSEAEAKAAGELERFPVDVRRAACGGFYYEEDGSDPCAPGDWEVPNLEFMASLPRDPKELYDDLSRQKDADTGIGMVDYIAHMLNSGSVPADLRAALYRVLGMVPGVRVTQQVASLDGRSGVAFGIADDEVRRDVIIDPGTSEYIGERRVFLKGTDEHPAGTLSESTSVTTAVVDGKGVRPTS
jgi:hypothetical protein